MAKRITFSHDRGIYGRAETHGYVPSPDSPFCVFKDADGKWSIGHIRSGLVINSAIPRRVVRSKARLLVYLSDMLNALPEQAALLGLIGGKDDLNDPDLAAAVRELFDWAREYSE